MGGAYCVSDIAYDAISLPQHTRCIVDQWRI